jgi:hypothetical protein
MLGLLSAILFFWGGWESHRYRFGASPLRVVEFYFRDNIRVAYIQTEQTGWARFDRERDDIYLCIGIQATGDHIVAHVKKVYIRVSAILARPE